MPLGKRWGERFTEFLDLLDDAEGEGVFENIGVPFLLSILFSTQFVNIECIWKRSISEAYPSRERST